MNNIDLSIIIPIYNKSKYIEKCLSSLLIENYYDYEILLIDDGSSDNSLKKCYEFKNDHPEYKIKVLSHENRGVSFTRNVGLNNCCGDYIMFMDADDYIDTKNLYDAIQLTKVNNIDILFSNVKKVDFNDNLLVENNFPYNGLLNMNNLFGEFYDIQSRTGLYGCVSNKIINRKIIEEYKIRFNININLAEDLDFYLSLYNYIDVVYFYNNTILYYLQNAENSSTSLQLVKTPDYLIQANILYKEYLLLRNKGVNSLNKLQIRISDYIIYYLKENCTNTNLRKQINILYNELFFECITFKNQSGFNRMILKLLITKKIYILSVILNIFILSRNIKIALKKGLIKNGK